MKKLEKQKEYKDKNYTFDFNGEVISSKIPNLEKLPPPHHNMK